jgi:hypothetical protein
VAMAANNLNRFKPSLYRLKWVFGKLISFDVLRGGNDVEVRSWLE